MVAPLELGICVADLDLMVAFYTGVLDCTEMDAATLPAIRTRPIGLASGDVSIVWLQTHWGERIKLLQPHVRPETPEVPAHLCATAGVAYLTFCVDDLHDVAARAIRDGAAPLTENLVTDNGTGTWIAFFRDPEGNVIELVERADLAAYRPDLS